MLMRLTKQQILNLHNGLVAVENFGGAKFAYTVAKNISSIKSEITALQKAYAHRDNYLIYDTERVELAQKYAIKVDGQPKTIYKDGAEEYAIVDQELFDKELTELKSKHEEAIEEREKQLRDFGEILKEDVDVQIYFISPSFLPDGITARQTADILLIIEDQIVN
jgi:hypothetical protein